MTATAAGQTSRIGPGYFATAGSAVTRVRRFDHRLRDQHAVEGVFVVGRQVCDCRRMSPRHGKLGIAVVEKVPAKQAGIDLKIIAAATCLDRDLPEADGAEHNYIAGILNNGGSCPGEVSRSARGPNQDMGVEQ